MKMNQIEPDDDALEDWDPKHQHFYRLSYNIVAHISSSIVHVRRHKHISYVMLMTWLNGPDGSRYD